MTLGTIQLEVRDILLRHEGLAALPIVRDDGTGEANPARQSALKVSGVCILIWRPESAGVIASSQTGHISHRIAVFVFVEQNQAVNTDPEAAADVTEYVMEALAGARGTGSKILLDDPPFENLGRVNGVNRFVVNATTELMTNPLTPATI